MLSGVSLKFSMTIEDENVLILMKVLSVMSWACRHIPDPAIITCHSDSLLRGLRLNGHMSLIRIIETDQMVPRNDTDSEYALCVGNHNYVGISIIMSASGVGFLRRDTRAKLISPTVTPELLTASDPVIFNPWSRPRQKQRPAFMV